MNEKKKVTTKEVFLEQVATESTSGIIVFKDQDGEIIIAEKLGPKKLSGRQFKASKAFQLAANFVGNEEAMYRFAGELEKLGKRIESCEKVSKMVQDKMDQLYQRKPRFGWRKL